MDHEVNDITFDVEWLVLFLMQAAAVQFKEQIPSTASG